MAQRPSPSSWSPNERLTPASRRNQAAAATATMAKMSRKIIDVCCSAASNAIRKRVATAIAVKPGHSGAPPFAVLTFDLDAFTDLFLNQSGRPPGHDGDDHGEGEDILVSAGKGQ